MSSFCALGPDLGVDGSDELLEVAVCLSEVLKSLHGVHRLALGMFVDLSDARVQRSLTLSDTVDILLALIDAGLLVLLTSACHLGKVGLASDLGLRAAHCGLNAANDGLLGGIFAPEAGLFDAVLDLLAGQKTALFDDLLTLLSQFLTKRAGRLDPHDSSVGWDVLFILLSIGGDIVLHPVDVERAWLLTIYRGFASFLDFDHFDLISDCFEFSLILIKKEQISVPFIGRWSPAEMTQIIHANCSTSI